MGFALQNAYESVLQSAVLDSHNQLQHLKLAFKFKPVKPVVVTPPGCSCTELLIKRATACIVNAESVLSICGCVVFFFNMLSIELILYEVFPHLPQVIFTLKNAA